MWLAGCKPPDWLRLPLPRLRICETPTSRSTFFKFHTTFARYSTRGRKPLCSSMRPRRPTGATLCAGSTAQNVSKPERRALLRVVEMCSSE